MDRVKQIFLFVSLIAVYALPAQNASSESAEGKNAIAINGLRYASVVSVSYGYRLFQSKNELFKAGFQTGIGYGHNIDSFEGWSIPFGLYGEYGKIHRVGIDANMIYQYETNEIRGVSVNGYTNYDAVFDNGVFTTSLYYSYNFGLNMRYAAGIGGSFISYFGSNYGIEIYNPNEFAPFIFFGVRF